MARTPTDATRFTATGPYASSSPTYTSSTSAPSQQGSQITFGSPAPANESPQQKIARLRAAAAASRQLPETSFDKVVRIGRRWADRAHRVTALSLIGLTVITGMVATAGITDMLMHNRRRRNEFFAEKRAQSTRELAEARAMQAEGRATEDQILLINRDRAAQEAEAEKSNRPGVFKRATGWLLGGVSSEEQKGGRLGSGSSQETVAEQMLGDQEDKGVLKAVEERIEAHRRTGEKFEETLRPLGGPLDRQADRAATAAADVGRSWTSWLRST